MIRSLRTRAIHREQPPRTRVPNVGGGFSASERFPELNGLRKAADAGGFAALPTPENEEDAAARRPTALLTSGLEAYVRVARDADGRLGSKSCSPTRGVLLTAEAYGPGLEALNFRPAETSFDAASAELDSPDEPS